MPIIIPDFSPLKSAKDAVIDRVTAALVAEWGKGNSAGPGGGDPATDYYLTEAPSFAKAAIEAMRLGMAELELACAAERNAAKGGVMMPGAETVALWNAMVDELLCP